MVRIRGLWPKRPERVAVVLRKEISQDLAMVFSVVSRTAEPETGEQGELASCRGLPFGPGR